MAKALILSDDTLAAPVTPPRAAQPATIAVVPKPVKIPKAPQVPLQIRISAADAKEIKRSALEADQTISEFMLACFHANIKND